MKRHGTNARGVFGSFQKNIHINTAQGASVRSSPSGNSLRYPLGIVMGLLIASLLTAPPTTVPSAAPQFAVIMKYRQMIERDDRAISLLLEVEMWDRSKPIFGRSYLLSNGGEVLAFTQNPRTDRFYELSF